MGGGQFRFTSEQEAAVKHRDGALLVSAAAGSGKTKVLVERLLSRITDGDDIDEFLIITYTRAAAAELREKIYDEILDRLANEPENRRLLKQSMLCRVASIDTIHGFCTDILRENAHIAELPPNFRVADESECDIIKAEILDGVLNDAYESIETSEGFRALIDTLSSGRDDKRLVKIILDTHAKLQSNPDPRAWVDKQIQRLPLVDVTDISETVWGTQLLDKTQKTVGFWLEEMLKVRNTMYSLPDFCKAYNSSIEATITDIGEFLTSLKISWDAARSHCNIDFSRVKPKPISGYDELKDIRLRCKNAMKKCALLFDSSSREHIEDMRAAAPEIKALLQLVLEFDNAYAEEKRRRGIVDFSDLEHLALLLLIDRNTGEKTGLAHTVSKRFKEIMVDEYQDVNAVQEKIFSAVSKDGKNIFMVGDVKQSIYRFRLADPSIFLEKYRKFTVAKSINASDLELGIQDSGVGICDSKTDTKDSESKSGPHCGEVGGTKILLSKNFRSRAGILNAVNFIFSNIMSVEFGEMDYTADEWLIPGRQEDDEANFEPSSAVEFDIIDMSVLEQDDDEEDPVKAQVEARFIAQRITELTNGNHKVPDGQGGMRSIQYSDIVILLRSIRGKAWQYSTALAERNIPVDMPDSEGFLESVEISAALALLSVIDNPMQDIPLAAAMRGPAYGFTDDELAKIRAMSRNTNFYVALLKTCSQEDGSALTKKCLAFQSEINALRDVMPDMPADRFIWHVYNTTGLLGRVGAMQSGDRRRNNLVLLAEYAREFELSGYKGLFGFLTYIRGLQERGADITRGAAASSKTDAINAVQIMSIHKSKGLEFPVVILADTSKRINNIDAQQPLVLHPELGAGPMRIDKERRIEYTTLARMAIQNKLTSEMMAEELRLLYVAMTRAREKLIITATYKDAEKEIEKLSKLSNGRIVPQILEDIKSMAGWILLPTVGQLTVDSVRGIGTVDSGRLTVDNGRGIGTVDSGQLTVDSGRGIGDSGLLTVDGGQGVEDKAREIWDIRIVPATAEFSSYPHSEAPQGILQSKTLKSARIEDVELLRERFSFVYPHRKAPELPSKLTVTGLKGQNIDLEAAILHPDLPENPEFKAEAAILHPDLPENPEFKAGVSIQHPDITENSKLQAELRKRHFTYTRPSFIAKKKGLTAAECGTALHLAMQHIDYTKSTNTGEINEELKRLTKKGLLTEGQAAVIETEKITRFFESDIGKRVLNAKNIKREFKFSLLYPAEQFYPDGGDDKILLQGIVDCFFEEDGALNVIDFKTDQMTMDTLEEKVNHYTPQLAAYSDALERITGKCVKERIIYFFTINKAVTV